MYGRLLSLTRRPPIFLLAEIAFVRLYDLTFSAHRRFKSASAHCFADAVGKKPSRVVLTAQFAVELMRGKAFLARCSEMERGGPLRKFGVASLHDAASHDREILTACRTGTAVHASLFGRVGFG